MLTEAITDAEKKAIDKLMKGEQLALGDFINEITTPLYHKLLEFTDNDIEKAQDYTNEIFLLILQAVSRMSKRSQ